MAFCCCKKSKHVEENEVKEVQTGLLHEEEEDDQLTTSDKKPEPLGLPHEEEEDDQLTRPTSDKKPEPLAAVQVTGVVDIGKKCATGVAKLPGSIYILCRNPSSVLIHRDESPFEYTGEVSLNDVEASWDLASSIKSSCLYLTDCTSNCVYKITSPSHEVSRWLEGIGYPHTLTVTSPDDQVLLLKCGSPSGLEIYGPDAVQVRRIQLPDEIEYPKHAVRTSSGNYVVSGKAKGSEAWGVLEVSVDGEILRHLTPHKQLTESYHLAIDSADRLIVADCWNHRLLMFDAGLSRSEELQPKDTKGELRWPWRLHYVASDNQLLVLQHDGRVGRDVADVEKDAAEGKIKEIPGEDGREAAGEKKEAKEQEKEKTTIEEDKTQNEGGKETAEEKTADKEEDEEKAIANGKMTEKTEGDNKKKGEEEEENEDEGKGEQERKRGSDHALVYIYSYI